MPVEAKLTRIEHDADPRRCEANGGYGQCHFIRTNDSVYCPIHGGNKNPEVVEKEKIRQYRLGKWQARVASFADDSGIKSLRDEIGILRMTLESLMVSCQDETELLISAPRISDLVIKIEKLVSSCHRLETSTGLLLDKSSALNIGASIVNIIGSYIKDPLLIDKIANEIASSILGIGHNEPD